jgi:hypothetical protein
VTALLPWAGSHYRYVSYVDLFGKVFGIAIYCTSMYHTTTMAAHRLVTTKELASLPRSVPHRALEVQMLVERTVSTRACEFDMDSTVFNMQGLDVVTRQPIRVYFYDAWATAASFLGTGDTVTLKGFVIHDIPNFRAEEASPDDLPTGESSVPTPPPQCFVTPCKGNTSILAVAQPAEQGDIIEVVVYPPAFEPTARVVKRRTSGITLASGDGKVLDDGVSRAE